MADLNFPNPGVQQTYTFVGKTWNWDGQRWAFASSGSGITKLNELTSSVQNFLIGYSGAFPNILSSGTDHTFNFPIAGTAATGLVNTSDQTFAGAKTFASTTNATYIGVGGVVVHGGIAISGNAAIGGSAIFTNTSNTNTIAFRAGIQGSTLSYIFPIDTPTAGQVLSASAPSSGVVTLSWEDDQTGAPAGGITQLNGLTAATQSFQTGTGGVDFGISSTTATHTFNLPDASASARGVITTGTQTIAGAKTFSSSIVGNLTGTATTSENVNVTTTTRSLTHYLTFTSATSGSGLALTTSAVGIGFTVNPAQNTLAAGTFIGNLSGTAATATNFYGSLVGNVTGTATTSQNVNVTTTTLSNNFYLTFANASSGSGLALTTSAVGMGLTYNPATNTLSAQLFTGTAFTARNSEVTTTTRSSDHYLLFANASSGTGLGLSTSAVGMGLTYNPATNTLSAQFFTGTATTSRNVDVTTTTRSFTHYLTFTNASSGSGLALTTSTIGIGFTVNPSQNTLAAGTFIGNLSGTAATATNFYGTLVGNSSTATTSQNVNTVVADTTGSHYLTFSPSNGGSGVALSTDGGLAFVPTTNVLTTGVFSGNLSATGATVTTIFDAQGDVSLGNATGDTVTFNARIGSHFNPSSDATYDLGLPSFSWRNAYLDFITGTAVTATNFYGTLTGNSSTATTSANLNTVAATTGTGHYILFSPTNGASGVAVSSDAQLLFSPSTNVLTADIFSGNLSGTAATATNFYGSLTGNVTGTATTAQNVNVTTTTAGGNFYLTFTNQSSGSGLALTTSTIGIGFTVNPAQNTLAAGTFIGNLSGTAATATNFYGTLVGNSSTATTSQNINVNTTTAGGNFYLTFTNQSSGSGLALTTSTIGIGFTVNPAQNTLAAGTFIGNLSGTAVTATNFYGTHIGNVTGTATTSQNVNVTTTTAGGNFYLTFTNQSSGSGLALTTSAIGIGFTVNPAQNTLAAGTFIGNLSGAAVTATNFYGTLTGNSSTATTSGNINTVAATTGTGHYILFSPVNGASGVAVSSDAQLLFSPSTNVLTADIFSGNLSGTAATATNFYGSLVGTATTSQNVNVNTTTAGGNFYLTFTNQSSGSGLALTTSTIGIGFTVNPAQNTLAAGTFIGNLSGSAVTATNFYGALTGNVTGTATTAQNVNITTTTLSNNFYLTFANASLGSGLALSTSAVGMGLTYNPATNTLSAQFFTGTASTSRNSVINSTTISSDHYLLFANASSGSGLALSASAVGMGLTYNPATNTLSAQFFTGTATTARNVVVNTTTRSANHYLLFSPDSSGSGVALTTSTVGMGLTYNPATNTLSAQFFTGTATTARNVDVTSTTAGGTHYLTFTNATSGSGLALTTSTIGIGFTVNPAQNTLAAGTFIGNVSGSATTSTYITGILRNASYVLGDLLAGASTGNTLTRVPVGANNRYFLKPDSTTQSGLGWSTFAGVFVTSLAPASPAFTLVEGDLWYKVDDGSFNVYYDVDETAQWVEIVSSGGPGGGTATTSENVNVNTTTINQNHYLLFSNRSSGSGVALTTSTIGIGFTVNPAENSLSAGLFAGNISGTAATFANIYGNTFGSLTGVEFSGGDVLIKTGKSLKIYEANNVYNTSFKANSSLAGNTDYTLPVGKPGTGASILQSDTAGSMIWVKAASNKATYVLSFGAGFTPTTGLDSVSIAIPYANDGSTSLTYTIKRVEVRTETEPGASTLAFYFERHTAGNAIWTVTPITIKGAASANFSVAQNNYVSSFTTITSSSGNNGEVASGNYLRVNFASVGTAANVSISIMIQEN